MDKAKQSDSSFQPPNGSETERPPTFIAGVVSTLSIPALVLFISFVGFGALTREANFSLGLSIFTTLTVFALPAQVVVADQVLNGAGLAAIALATTLTAIRLLPLTASFLPLLREEKMDGLSKILACHFIAVTIWVEGHRRLPHIKPGQRLSYYWGMCSALMCVSVLGTAIGYALAANVPPGIQAGLLFLTPIYFLLSLLTVAANHADKVAIGLGLIMGPLLFWIVPGFELLLTGLIGGSIAYGVGRWS